MVYKEISAFILVLVLFFLALSSQSYAQKYTGSPVTKARLIKAIQSKQFAVPVLVKQIAISGTDFEVTPAVERELLAVRANQLIIKAARDNYRYRGQTARRPGAMPGGNVADDNYESLFYQGLEALNRLRTASSQTQAGNLSRSLIDLGNKAIRSNPARSEAYILVGSAHLLMRNFAESQRYCQLAIDRGGSPAFPVYHLSGTPHIETLYVGRGFVTIESNQKFFQFDGLEISSPGAENDYQMNGVRVAVFSLPTFKSGRRDIWYFTPGNTGTPQEANMIMELIKRNSIGR